jgi:DNA polymerase/3'-5' exonuclease PolX
MKLQDAKRIAWEVIECLSPGCEQIVYAGSTRREKPEVKDLEIVYISKMVPQQIDLFTTDLVPATEELIADLVDRRLWLYDDVVRRNGPKYRRMMHAHTGFTIELFRAQTDNWGLTLALRTGPAEFNHWLVNRMGGAMPVDMCMRDGYLWKRGKRLDSPDEETFFAQIGVPCWPPKERSKKRLTAFLKERGVANYVLQ